MGKKRSYVLVLCLLFVCNSLLASSFVDSLTKQLSVAENVLEQCKIATSIARFYDNQEEQERAYEWAQKALVLCENHSYLPGILENKYILANVQNSYGDYTNALAAYEQCLKLADEQNDSLLKGPILYGIGSIYWQLRNYAKALEFIRKSSFFDKYRNDPYNSIITTFSIGSIYSDMGNDSAIFYMNEALDSAIFYGYNAVASSIYNNLGDHYLLQGKHSKAISQFRNGLELIDKTISSSTENLLYGNLAYAFAYLNKLDSAKWYSNRLHEKSLQAKRLDEIAFSYQIKYFLDSLEGNYAQSLANYQLYKAYQDSMHNNELRDKLVNFEILYKLNNINAEISNLKQENRLKEIVVNSQRIVNILLTGIAFLLATIFFLAFIENKKKKALNEQLEAVNIELIENTKELKKKSDTLQQSNMSKDRFISIVAHDLKNPLNGMKSMTSMFLADYEILSEEKKKRMMAIINDSTQKVSKLVEDLLEWSRTQNHQIKFNPEEVNLKVMAELAIDYLLPTANQKSIIIENLIPDTSNISADKHMLFTIFRNLLSNAIKFSMPGNRVTLKLTNDANHLYLHFVDCGVGIDPLNLANIFTLDHATNTRGTAGETGTGLGLIICNEFVQAHNGSIEVESEPSVGTTFMVTLPKR